MNESSKVSPRIAEYSNCKLYFKLFFQFHEIEWGSGVFGA